MDRSGTKACRLEEKWRGIMIISRLNLDGLNGSNPLGFLAALGVVAVISPTCSKASLHWEMSGRGWVPVLSGCGTNRKYLITKLYDALKAATTRHIFDVPDQFPFEHSKLASQMVDIRAQTSVHSRRSADMLAAFGSEVYKDDKGCFTSSKFRMVRNIDKLPCRVKNNLELLEQRHLESTLFNTWTNDEQCKPLRWDPDINKRHALEGGKPLHSNTGMLAANCLAVEALQFYPTMSDGRRIQTTGFTRQNGKWYFVWPIWTPPVRRCVLRSLLAMRHNNLMQLAHMGIVQIYVSSRISDGHYGNFGPAVPQNSSEVHINT